MSIVMIAGSLGNVFILAFGQLLTSQGVDISQLNDPIFDGIQQVRQTIFAGKDRLQHGPSYLGRQTLPTL